MTHRADPRRDTRDRVRAYIARDPHAPRMEIALALGISRSRVCSIISELGGRAPMRKEGNQEGASTILDMPTIRQRQAWAEAAAAERALFAEHIRQHLEVSA